MTKVGVLGVGELAEKILHGLLRQSADVAIFLSPRNHQRVQALAGEHACEIMESNQAVADASDIVLICVRPWQLRDLAREVVLRPGQILVSVVAGVTVAELQALFGTEHCVRAMLSYASEINRAAVAVYPADLTTKKLLRPLGSLMSFSREVEFELATIGACMNGWFYFLLHDLQHWLVEKGLPPDRARTLVLNNIEDCVAYAKHHDGLPMGDLGRSIVTPGTFSAEGLEMLGLHQANAAWSAACEVVLDALSSRTEDELQQKEATTAR
jgi:pyrroline-5-carboxylate reductase